MAAIEISAPDLENAISLGLKQLNLMRAEVKIEILDEGSRGVLGLGAKPARVRLTPFEEIEAAEATAKKVASAQTPVDSNVEAESDGMDDDDDLDYDDADDPEADSAVSEEHDDAAPKIDGEDLAFTLVRGIIDRMGLPDVGVTARSVFPIDSDDEPSIWINVDLGEEEDLLLGYQSEGLNALQTIVQTMWSHQTKSSLRVNLDVNGYRARREQQLMNMAHRMAERVLESGKPITLEPMPARDRRIVHMTLREIDGVETESSGEGPMRKVQIKPKK